VRPLSGADLDLGQVRAFVAVVDHGHFGRAAASMALSQQALSKRIARLEDVVGPLLERRRGGVVPTAAGARFLPAARRLLDLAGHAVAQTRGAPPPALRVDVWGEIHAPARLMRAIGVSQPDLVLELSMRRDLGDAIMALEAHQVDLAFGNVEGLEREPAPELSSEIVARDRIAILLHAGDALAERGHVTPDDLVRRGIWWPTAGSSRELRAFADAYARSIGARLTSVAGNLGLDALVEHVASNPGTLAPVVDTWPVTGREGVRVLPLLPAPHFPWYAVWRTGDSHPSLPGVLRALRFLR
jgi:DNA-binding transcriptional LysR family regulator